jgi:hypothetical protein
MGLVKMRCDDFAACRAQRWPYFLGAIRAAALHPPRRAALGDRVLLLRHDIAQGHSGSRIARQHLEKRNRSGQDRFKIAPEKRVEPAPTRADVPVRRSIVRLWLCLDRALKCHLSRFKCGQFLLEIGNFLVDSSQFGPGLFTHQVF